MKCSLHHCIRLFYRAVLNTGTVDRVLHGPFHSSGTTYIPQPRGAVAELLQPPSAERSNTVTTEGKGHDEPFHFISSINHCINVSVTAPVKNRAFNICFSEPAELAGFGPSHTGEGGGHCRSVPLHRHPPGSIIYCSAPDLVQRKITLHTNIMDFIVLRD